MIKLPKYIKDSSVAVAILGLTFIICFFLQQFYNIEHQITTVFVFAVFLISLFTDGYLYGIVSAVVSMLMVNFAFTFPYFALNFKNPVHLLSAIMMIIISILTGTLATKLKHNKAVNAEVEKERMRANLLRAVSHDLRTPLTTIYGSACTLLENNAELSSSRKAAILKDIKEDSEWLVRMVENLLSITRIDSGNVKIIKTPTVLEELIDSVIIKFNKRYPEQKVLLDIPDDLIVIPMDAMLIEQVIINILENAVEHAKGMTSLTLRVFTLGEKAIFEIEDDGPGIEKEKIKTIFTGQFVSGEQPADGQRRNSGIGLSVCATIIKAHGGDISAENRKTSGCVFRFSLMKEME